MIKGKLIPSFYSPLCVDVWYRVEKLASDLLVGLTINSLHATHVFCTEDIWVSKELPTNYWPAFLWCSFPPRNGQGSLVYQRPKKEKSLNVRPLFTCTDYFASEDANVWVKNLLTQQRPVNFRDTQTLISGFNMKAFSLLLAQLTLISLNGISCFEVWSPGVITAIQIVWRVL